MKNENKPIDPRNVCRCCGWDFGYPPWGEDGQCSTFDICSCCGCEAGNEDSHPVTLLEYREKWIKSGAPWFEPKDRPENWSLENQMANIPEQYRNIVIKPVQTELDVIHPVFRAYQDTARTQQVKQLRNKKLKELVDSVKTEEISFKDVDRFFCYLSDQNTLPFALGRHDITYFRLLPDLHEYHLFLLYEKILWPVLHREIENKNIDAAIWAIETEGLFLELMRKDHQVFEEMGGDFLSIANQIDPDHPFVFSRYFFASYDWLSFGLHHLPDVVCLGDDEIDTAFVELKMLAEKSRVFDVHVQEAVERFSQYAIFHYTEWKKYIEQTPKDQRKEKTYKQFLISSGYASWIEQRKCEIKSGVDYSYPNYPPVFCYKRLRSRPDRSLFSTQGLDTPEKAIAAGYSIDRQRKEELALNIEPLRGKTVRAFRWTLHCLVLEFDDNACLILEAAPKSIDVRIGPTPDLEANELFIYEIKYPNPNHFISYWRPEEIALQFVGKKFMNIQLEHRVVWLYFSESETLIQVVQSSVLEYQRPILRWEEGV